MTQTCTVLGKFYCPLVFLLMHRNNSFFRQTTLKGYVKLLGLTTARSGGHTFETIAGPIAELREMYPTAGANALHVYMRNHFDMHVAR